MSRSGPTPFGYRRKGDQLISDPTESEVRRKIFELFVSLQRQKAVADELGKRGFKTKSGSDFSSQMVGRILKDDLVLGRDENVEQIVSDELFEKCQNVLTGQAKKGGAARLPNHPFAGIAYCGCGGKMYVPTKSRKYVCRKCRAKIGIRDLETIFVETIVTTLEKQNPKSKILSAFKEWPILSLRSKIGLTQTAALRVDINNNKVRITLFDM